MEQTPQELTSLVGREVYSNNGVYVGTIEDLRLNLEAEAVTGIALTDVNDEIFAEAIGRRQGVLIPYRWVRSVGDIVIITDTIERLRSEEDADDEANAAA